jgi:hypothetical protein
MRAETQLNDSIQLWQLVIMLRSAVRPMVKSRAAAKESSLAITVSPSRRGAEYVVRDSQHGSKWHELTGAIGAARVMFWWNML